MGGLWETRAKVPGRRLKQGLARGGAALIAVAVLAPAFARAEGPAPIGVPEPRTGVPGTLGLALDDFTGARNPQFPSRAPDRSDPNEQARVDAAAARARQSEQEAAQKRAQLRAEYSKGFGAGTREARRLKDEARSNALADDAERQAEDARAANDEFKAAFLDGVAAGLREHAGDLVDDVADDNPAGAAATFGGMDASARGGFVSFLAGCDTACRITAKGTVFTEHRVLRLRRVKVTLSRSGRREVVMRLTTAGRGAAARAVGRGEHVFALIDVVAHTADGATVRRTLRASLG
jgi:hypothetical protein